ncbi:hypothetical protein VXP99_09095 [Acinetobacter towneri]|uniref:hypothetical protein n=1 Tax=Acinetobacter towneri TaxID=202956 RepID=UPI003A8B0E4C
MNTKVNEGKLISGKEALIALANGEEVQIWNGNIWWDVEGDYQINVFLKTERNFRLKPRTITINGIEVPASAEDKDCHHQGIWILNSLELKEYSYVVLDIADEPPRYWWSTEEEVKQVVAALHQVFGGSHDN